MEERRFRAIKAYRNEAFLNSPDARSLRILAEYLEPESRFEELRLPVTIVVLGSARIHARDLDFADIADVNHSTGSLASHDSGLLVCLPVIVQ